MAGPNTPTLNYQTPPPRPRVSPGHARWVVRIHLLVTCCMAAVLFFFSLFLEPTGVLLGGVFFLLVYPILLCVVIGPIGSRDLFEHVSLKRFYIHNIVALVLGASICYFQWPMRLRYVFSASALDRLAAQAMTGPMPQTPVRAGLVTIRRIQLRPGGVCLWVDPNTAGPSGFVMCAPGTNPPANDGRPTRLSDRWHFVVED